MAAGIYNLEIERGETYSKVFTWQNSDLTPIDLTGFTARMQLRKTYDSNVIILDCASYIVLGGVLGTITLTIPATTTANLPVGLLAYDLELVTGSVVTKPLKGSVTVYPEVTR